MATPNNNPIFPLQPIIGSVTLAAANTARDGSGTIVTVLTGNSNNEQIKMIRFNSAQASPAANSAMVVRVWIGIVGTGTTWYLFDEANFAAVTASNSAKGQQVDFTYGFNLRLTANQKLGVTKSLHAGVQDQVQVVVFADTLGS